MESSDDLEPEMGFFYLCVFCHKRESVDSLGRGTVQGLFLLKEVCKLRLENE